MFSHIVITEVKEDLVKNMSKFQTAKPGHRSQENLYVLKSVMANNEKYDRPSIYQFMDLEKYFDKEALTDVLAEAHKNNVKR